MLWGKALSAAELANLDNMVMFLPLDANGTDYSNYGNHAKITGAIGAPDRFGNPQSAYRLDGINDKIIIPNSSTYKVGFPFTMSAWVNLSDSSRNSQIFMTNDNTTTYAGAWLQVVNGVANIGYGNNVNAGSQFRKTLFGKDTLKSNSWHHIVGIFQSATNIKLYINGNLDTRATFNGSATSIAYNNNDAQLGHSTNPFGPDVYTKGSIDHIVMWKRALSGKEANNLFTPGLYISQHPTGITVNTGAKATLTIQAVGSAGDMKYQWQKKTTGTWQSLLGKTNNVLSINSAQSLDQADYRCIVQSLGNKDTTNSARITVKNTSNTQILNTSKLKIFPNPGGDELLIDLGEVQNNTRVIIRTVFGTEVYSAKVPQVKVVEVNTSALSTGCYTVEVISGTERLFGKWIKN